MNDLPENRVNLQEFSDGQYARPHDRYITETIGSNNGEPTHSKQRSLRSRRGIFTFALTAFTIGALMIVLTSPYSKEFLAPGPLSSPHAQLLAGHGADRCAACHGAASSSIAGWVGDTLSGGHATGVSQSDLCMECHRETIPENFALNPHNLPPKELAEKSNKFKQASFVGKTLSLSPVNNSGEVACSACHREHKGKQDLKALTNAQCQSCHQDFYHSFESNHPEFASWPQASRQKIAFDHSTHAQKHFPGKQELFNCSQCHVDDDYQNVKSLASFDASCAKCHEQSILDSAVDGIAIFKLPMLDMDAISESKLEVGSWPVSATGDFDGELPPIMRLLLMADSSASEVFKRQNPDFQFSDFNAEDSQSVRDAVTLVWATKKLLRDLSAHGETEISKRLEKVLARPIEDCEIESLTAGLSKEALLAAANRWLPGLNAEVNNKFPQDAQPSSATFDDLLRPQGETIARIAQDETQQLADNPLAGLLNGKSPRANTDSQKSTSSTDQGEQPAIQLTQKSSGATQPVKVVNRSVGPISNVPIFTKHVATGRIVQTGWHRDDQALQIAYRPTEHKDGFLKHWTQLVADTADSDSRTETKPLFEALTNPMGAGNCKSCHTMERNVDRTFQVNWAPQERDPAVRDFTFFSHAPHLIQPKLKDCSYCHELDTSISNADTFASFDDAQCKSNFLPITKASCAECHQKGLTSNDCTQCHGYHIGGHKSK